MYIRMYNIVHLYGMLHHYYITFLPSSVWGTSSTTEHHLQQGKQSLASGQFADALHHYSKAISESSQ